MASEGHIQQGPTKAKEEDTQLLLQNFRCEKILNEDTGFKTLTLLGTLNSHPALIIAERTSFDTTSDFLPSLSNIRILGQNDVYHWFLGSQTSTSHPDVKFTFIYPATDTHIRKYSRQSLRMVTETPEIYNDHVKRYVEAQRGNGKLTWVYNLLEHKDEVHRIVYEDQNEQTGKWDQITMSALYMMALVRRRDVTSIRDLRKRDIPWLRSMKSKITNAIVQKYANVQEDQLKLYVHYHPSYYHFHIHAVALSHDGAFGQTAGKALLLGNVINMLEIMAGDEAVGLDKAAFDIVIGEESELWQSIYAKLKDT